MRLQKWLTVDEVAGLLRCRRETVRCYIADGRLPAYRIPGGYYRIKEQDINSFLQPVSHEDDGPRRKEE